MAGPLVPTGKNSPVFTTDSLVAPIHFQIFSTPPMRAVKALVRRRLVFFLWLLSRAGYWRVTDAHGSLVNTSTNPD